MTLKTHVLVVDDDADLNVTLTKCMEWAGYTVSSAANARKVQQLWYDGQRPDIVLTDFKMPGMNGVQLIEWLRTQGSQAGFILLSGNISEIPRTVASDVPIVAKPFSMHTMLAMVAQLASRKAVAP